MADNMLERMTAIIREGIQLNHWGEDIARAVLTSMREPTEAMDAAGGDHAMHAAYPIWQAMIDAALKEEA